MRHTFLGRALGLVLLVLAVTALSEQPSYAYIDPGTGSYVLQVIAAGLFAAVFAVGAFWRRIKTAISGVFSRRDQD